MTIEYTEFIKTTEALLFSSDFKVFEEKLEFREPNLWQILNISRRENLVSQFLAWLLNPQSQHSFGAQFLKRFIIEVLRIDKDKYIYLSPVEIAVMDLSRAEVEIERSLEKRRCDIVIRCPQTGFVCVIENKVGAKEGKEQTKYYYEHSFSVFPQKTYPKRVYIYLSPYGSPAKCEHFVSVSYQTILVVIKGLLSEQQITETERFLLLQFQESLRRSVAMDQKTLDLAQSIYENYKPVIDFIYENAVKSDSQVSDMIWDQKSWFFNIGDVGETPYSWDDSKQYSFICAGGDKKYRRLMENFKPGHIIYAYRSGSGYVGIGTVTKTALPFREATLEDNHTKLVDLRQSSQLLGTYNASEDDDNCDWIVLVKWEKAVEKSQAVRLNPIVPSTASRVYEHRKPLIEKVRQGLGLKK